MGANDSHPLPVQFAVLLALVFAKIARTDYPRQWPSLMDDLLAVMAEGDGLRRRRAYLVLHHVLKELSSKRLAADQRTFVEVGLPLVLHQGLLSKPARAHAPISAAKGLRKAHKPSLSALPEQARASVYGEILMLHQGVLPQLLQNMVRWPADHPAAVRPRVGELVRGHGRPRGRSARGAPRRRPRAPEAGAGPGAMAASAQGPLHCSDGPMTQPKYAWSPAAMTRVRVAGTSCANSQAFVAQTAAHVS